MTSRSSRPATGAHNSSPEELAQDRIKQAETWLESRIERTRVLMRREQRWPRLWLLFSLIAGFILLTLFDVWHFMPPLLHQALLLAFAGLGVFSLINVMRVPLPDRAAAIRRLEQRSGVQHTPATSFLDHPASDEPIAPADNLTTGIWQHHRMRQITRLLSLKPGPFDPAMERHDPLALRTLLILALVTSTIALGAAFPQKLERAFTIADTTGPVRKARLDAWVTPPAYTALPPIVLANNRQTGTAHTGKGINLIKSVTHLFGAQKPEPKAKRPARTMIVPENSLFILRLTGPGQEALTPQFIADGKPLPVTRTNSAATKTTTKSATKSGPAAAGTEPASPRPRHNTVELRQSGKSKQSGKTGHTQVREYRYRLSGPIDVVIKRGDQSLMKWVFQIQLDNPPTIALRKKPGTTHRGVLKLEYQTADDYGVATAKARFALATPDNLKKAAEARLFEPDPLRSLRNPLATAPALPQTRPQQATADRPPAQVLAGDKPLFGPPALALKLPPGNRKRLSGRVFKNLTYHPWAGMRVLMRLEARDFADQTGVSAIYRFRLPERHFRNPLAKAIVELRKQLIMRPRTNLVVAGALDRLVRLNLRLIPDSRVLLALRATVWRLRYNRDIASLRSAANLMWDTALRLEDGDLSTAERALRAAQDRLMNALQQNASEQEIKRLLAELKRELARYLRALAKQAKDQKPSSLAQKMQQQMQTMSMQDLNRMLRNIENLAKTGARDQAQAMLQQMRDLLENLRASRQNMTGQNQAGQQMMQALDQFGKMLMQQRRLHEQTFKLKKAEDQRLYQDLFSQRQSHRQSVPRTSRASPGQQSQQPGQGQRQRLGQQSQQGQQSGEQQSSPQTGTSQPSQSGQQTGQNAPGQNRLGQNAQSQNMPAQNMPGTRPGAQSATPGALAGQQQQLRNRLVDLLTKMQRAGIPANKPLTDSARAMDSAARSLQDEDLNTASEQQARAMTKLREGTRALVEKLLKRMGQQMGMRGMSSRDPLGRNRSDTGPDFGLNVKVPDEIVIQRAREILDELRRRSGDQTRPPLELDYIERLIRQF